MWDDLNVKEEGHVCWAMHLQELEAENKYNQDEIRLNDETRWRRRNRKRIYENIQP